MPLVQRPHGHVEREVKDAGERECQRLNMFKNGSVTSKRFLRLKRLRSMGYGDCLNPDQKEKEVEARKQRWM